MASSARSCRQTVAIVKRCWPSSPRLVRPHLQPQGGDGPSHAVQVHEGRCARKGVVMNVLAVDVGGTHVKILATGEKTARKFISGPNLTPQMMVAGVKELAADWKYDAVSIGYPGPVLRVGRLRNPITSRRAGLVSLSKPPSAVP